MPKLPGINHLDAVRAANPREVVPKQVDDHDVFRSVFLAVEEFLANCPVGLRLIVAPAGTLDGPSLNRGAVDAQEPFGRGAEEGINHEMQ